MKQIKAILILCLAAAALLFSNAAVAAAWNMPMYIQEPANDMVQPNDEMQQAPDDMTLNKNDQAKTLPADDGDDAS